MAQPGGGKYDDVLTEIRKRLKAEGVCLIVIGGERGEGFGIQATERGVFAIEMALEGVLRNMRGQTGDGPHWIHAAKIAKEERDH